MRSYHIVPILIVTLASNSPACAFDIATWDLSINQLVSAFGITTKQHSVNAGHDTSAETQAKSAAIATILTQDNALRVAKVKENYSLETGTGYSVCHVNLALADERNSNVSAKKLTTAFQNADANWLQSGGDGPARIGASLNLRRTFYCTQAQKIATGWCSGENIGGFGAGDSDAGIFLLQRNYGAEETITSGDYLDVIAPMPTIKPNAATAEEQWNLIQSRRRGAQLSGARAAFVRVITMGQGGDIQSGDTR